MQFQLILDRELTELLSIPEKFLLFAILALNSLIVFSGGPTLLSALLLLDPIPNHQNIKATTQSSPQDTQGAQH